MQKFPLVPVTFGRDRVGVIAHNYARIINPLGYALDFDEKAPPHSIAFFSSASPCFGSRCIKMRQDRFEEFGIEVPAWAESAPYRIAIKDECLWKKKDLFLAGIAEAVRCSMNYCNRLEQKRRWAAPLGIISPIPRGLPSEVAA
jgi:hypothetical protein